MIPLRANQALVADHILLDGRLALFHQGERWLTVADLHFGYELSQRAAGRLVPLWGMASISERLLQLVREYQPARRIVLGDLVHDQTAAREAAERSAIDLLDHAGIFSMGRRREVDARRAEPGLALHLGSAFCDCGKTKPHRWIERSVAR